MPNERLALLLILLLSALLAVPAKGAVRPVGPLPAAPLARDLPATEEEEEGEAFEDETGEEETVEDEGCETGEACEAEAGEGEECLLTGAEATVSAGPHVDVLRVAIRYTAFRPAAVAVSYQVRGGAGGVRLGAAQAHFGRKGVFHDTIAIGDRDRSRVHAAREVAIGLHALNTPAYCRQVFQQHLTPRRSGNRLLFS